jgi:hypothetical protein
MTAGLLQDMEEVKLLGTELLGGVSDAAEAAQAALLDLKESMLKLQLVVEGCTAFVPAKECKSSTSLSNINACIQQLDGSVTHELGQGIIVSQSGSTTPTCNSSRVCPCCAECSKGAVAIDSVIRMLPTKKSLEVFKYPTIQPATFSKLMIGFHVHVHVCIYVYLHFK